jgi:hypothetical protein
MKLLLRLSWGGAEVLKITNLYQNLEVGSVAWRGIGKANLQGDLEKVSKDLIKDSRVKEAYLGKMKDKVV